MNEHRLSRRGALAAGLTAATTAAVASCSGPSSTPPQGKSTGGGQTAGGGGGTKGALNAYLYQKPKLFSPLEPANGPDGIVMDLVFDSLLKVSPDNKLVGSLATDVPTVSKDAKTFTYKLRTGMKWSDGQPFSSKDVVFTYNLLANSKSGSAAAGTFSAVVGFDEVASGKAKTVSGFTAPDDNTFVVKVKEPNIGFAALISTMSMLPEHVLGKVPLDKMGNNDFFNKPTVSIGPYIFVTYKTDQYVELKANPNYREKVNISKIFLKPVTTDVAVAQLGTGEMDLVQISPTDMSTVKSMKNIKIASKTGNTYIQLDINEDRKYFKDPRVRQAMLYAVNRKALVDKALKGEGSVINSSFLLGDVTSQAKLNDYPYDPGKAKKLLQEAGWDPKQKFYLWWIPGQSDRDTAATIVQSQLQAVGMNCQLKKVQAAQLLDSIGKARTFDVLLGGGGGRPPEPWTIYNVSGCNTFYPDHGANVNHFCNKKFDALMKQANQTPDKTKRMQLYAQAAEISNQDPPFLWIFAENVIWAYNSRISGFVPGQAFTQLFWNVANWKLTS